MGISTVVIIFTVLGIPLILLFWLIFGGIAINTKINNLYEKGVMSYDIKNQAYQRSLSGVKLSSRDANLNNILNRIDKYFLASYYINVHMDPAAEMIIFETKYLVGANLRLIEYKDDIALFEFKIMGRGDYTGRNIWHEVCCNIIITALKKAVI